MNILAFLLIAPLVAADVPVRTIVLPDLSRPHQLVVDGNSLFVFDEEDYSLHAYSIAPFALKWKFGRKGDGPVDFKYLPLVHAGQKSLACTDFTKIVWLSEEGAALKSLEFSQIPSFDLNSEMLLIPVKERYLMITANHNGMKRYAALLEADLKTVKNLYEGPFVWQTGSATDVRTDALVSQGLIFIADTLTFRISIFDDKGNLIRTIDRSGEAADTPGQALLHQYGVSDGKIYAVANHRKDGQREIIVMNLEGRVLKRSFLPLASIRPNRGVLRSDLFAFDRDKLYELIQDSQTKKWELLITDIASDI